MRQFILENGEGDWLHLQSEKFFASGPAAGLGYADIVKFSASERGFFNKTNIEAGQPNIVFDLLIKKGRYRGYSEFVDWLQKAGDLRLIYRQERFKQYCMDVVVESVDMNEAALRTGTVEVSVSLRGTSPYYIKTLYKMEFNAAEALENPMVFPLRFPFRFERGISEDEITVEPEGHFPAAIELFANGPLSKPVLRAYAGGGLIGEFDASAISLKEGEQLHYSSRPNAAGAWKVSNGIKSDAAGLLDISRDNFFTLPAGGEISLALSADCAGGRKLVHELYLYEYYRG